jgi:hypothetical protein
MEKEIFEITKVADGSPVSVELGMGENKLKVSGDPGFVFATLDELLENCPKFQAFVRDSLGDCTKEEFDESLDRQLAAAGFKPRAIETGQ